MLDERIVVVYLYIPTSNHNLAGIGVSVAMLYIFIFLHQTTTFTQWVNPNECCISLYSYIKPQLSGCNGNIKFVVYLYIPTSNHNVTRFPTAGCQLYIFIFLHQTTTPCAVASAEACCISLYSYIKPQLCCVMAATPYRCISLYSYIKPQLPLPVAQRWHGCISLYSYIKPQLILSQISTELCCISLYSYIKPQLDKSVLPTLSGCISLYSYIKPQLANHSSIMSVVVYLYIPTSNHNLKKRIY